MGNKIEDIIATLKCCINCDYWDSLRHQEDCANCNGNFNNWHNKAVTKRIQSQEDNDE
jgi:hypothetical protein